jgi:hypothetical protein
MLEYNNGQEGRFGDAGERILGTKDKVREPWSGDCVVSCVTVDVRGAARTGKGVDSI